MTKIRQRRGRAVLEKTVAVPATHLPNRNPTLLIWKGLADNTHPKNPTNSLPRSRDRCQDNNKTVNANATKRPIFFMGALIFFSLPNGRSNTRPSLSSTFSWALAMSPQTSLQSLLARTHAYAPHLRGRSDALDYATASCQNFKF